MPLDNPAEGVDGLGVRSLSSQRTEIYGGSQGLLWNTQDFFLIFIFRAFSILHFTTYVDNASVAKTTKFSELRKLLPTNDAQGNPTRGTAQARSRGPSPFRGRAHPRSRGGPRAAKMGTKICYQVVELRKLLPTNLERSTRTIIFNDKDTVSVPC